MAEDRPRVAAGWLQGPAYGWLVLGLALATLPHMGHMPWWLGVLFLGMAAWRWRATSHGWNLPRRGLLVVVTLVAGVGILLSYGTLLGRDAGIAMLSAMASLKLLELRSVRDGMVLVFLGYFLVMGNLLYTQSLVASAYLLVTVLVLISAQVMIHRQHAALPLVELLRLSTRMLLQSLPIMLVLFVLFPRLPGPLWGLPKDTGRGQTGLSSDMTPGSITRLSRSDAVAFRVRFRDPAPPTDMMYWRGPVLWNYDGRTWTAVPEPSVPALEYHAEGQATAYTVMLEPHGQRWLFGLDLPATVPARGGVTASFQMLSRERITEVMRYRMSSYLDYRTGPLDDWERRRALQLPSRINPRARRLAGQWRAESRGDATAVIQKAMALFREEAFHYTLSPPPVSRVDGIDDFLFNTRRGFCEYYAGSFVFLMRAAGVPARVVTGYQGGEFNELADYFIVRQSDAHAWAEVWLEGQGWMRLDPTAAVTPQRVEQGVYAAVSDPYDLAFFSRRDGALIRQLIMGWDALNITWNEWVLAYGPDRQRQVLSGLGVGPMDWRGLTVAMVVGLTAIGLGVVSLRALRRRGRIDPVSSTYHRFCAKLGRSGLVRAPHEGPLDFAGRVSRARPELAPRVWLISRLYARMRYGRDEPGDQLERLQRLVKEFRA